VAKNALLIFPNDDSEIRTGLRERSLSRMRPYADKMEDGAARRTREPLSCWSPVRFNYPVVEEEVELPGPMFVQVCVDVPFVLLAAVVLDAAAALALLAAPVVCADANPIEAIPAIAATTVTMMRE
jgi:hypothetical protein